MFLKSIFADNIPIRGETYAEILQNTVEIDFEKCFDNIPLDTLMFTSKEYSGVGLGQENCPKNSKSIGNTCNELA